MEKQSSSLSIIDFIKENIILFFSLSLVVSYFACYGYFLNFNFDITTFLSIEDLTVIFAKWFWLVVFTTIIGCLFIFNLFKNIGTRETWLDKTLGKSNFKRRSIFILIFLILVIVFAIIFKEIAQILRYIAFATTTIVLALGLITFAYSSISNKQNISNSSQQDFLNLIVTIFMVVVFIPIIVGLISGQNIKFDTVHATFEDDKILNLKDSANCIYIGKTTNYFFTYDTLKKHATAYNMDKVKSITLIITK